MAVLEFHQKLGRIKMHIQGLSSYNTGFIVGSHNGTQLMSQHNFEGPVLW